MNTEISVTSNNPYSKGGERDITSDLYKAWKLNLTELTALVGGSKSTISNDLNAS